MCVRACKGEKCRRNEAVHSCSDEWCARGQSGALITDQPVCVRRRLLLEQASKFQAYCMCQTPDLGQRFGQNGFGQRSPEREALAPRAPQGRRCTASSAVVPSLPPLSFTISFRHVFGPCLSTLLFGPGECACLASPSLGYRGYSRVRAFCLSTV